jgi:acetyltransferase-like isoleucine patch superfamily enzyme
MMSVITWLRGFALLRYPELVRDLGERRFELLELQQVRQHSPLARIDRHVKLIGYKPSRLNLGPQAHVCDGSVLAFGDETNGFGAIEVGAHTWIGQYNNLRAGGGSITIGRHCLISQFCTLVASNHGTERLAPIQGQSPDPGRRDVQLGDDVWLGAGVVVTPGVTIGNGAVIGANAVVTYDVPDYEIWAGVPARRIGERQ